jgi:hypothetical protein
MGRQYSVLEILEGFPVCADRTFACVEKFGIYTTALVGAAGGRMADDLISFLRN